VGARRASERKIISSEVQQDNMAKYIFTSEMDKEILFTYSINTDSKPRLINLAKKFNIPR
jgi:hypothetical protein